ncbi:MAG TPA: BRCT domain-containing protein, partial [Thermodesulfobacteriota bacterium]|nr:BRCT domain-containing protein [Thermodesulfobacteriota bacterium]
GIRGIGEQIASSIVKFFQQAQNRAVIRKLRDLGVEYPAPAAAPQAGRKLDGRSFVFTGALKTMSRSDAEKRVESLGGRASSSVSKKTDYVVVGEDPGSKYEKAKQLGVKTISEEEFAKMLAGDGGGHG